MPMPDEALKSLKNKNIAADQSLWQDYNEASYMEKTRLGVDEELIRRISQDKDEPAWMLEKRLASWQIYCQSPWPSWGPDLQNLDLGKITYYARAFDRPAESWSDVPTDIRETFDKLGIPRAEQEVLAGVGAQYESTVIYHNLQASVKEQGVIFEDLDLALKKHEPLVKKYFMRCVPPELHKFSALHGAVWSGGTFLYIPRGVKLDLPLQAYFRMNARGMGQFEHTLIIVEDEAVGHYIEGCSAPRYGANSLHAGGVEIFLGKNSHFRYSSVESWSKDTYNLNTKRALVAAGARMEWVGGNFGSQVTMLYPCSVLEGRGASADHLGLAFAGAGQIQDTGAKVIHLAPQTSSNIVMKSISKQGGTAVYRGLVDIAATADHASTNIQCDALLLDSQSRSDTWPFIKIKNQNATVAHEASAGKLNEEDIFYLRSRGLTETEAKAAIVNGFIEKIVRELPLEYAVEMNRMIELEMEGSVG